MKLSDLHLLPTASKRQWLRSDAGLTQLRNWVTEGITVYHIARMLEMSSTTLSDWRRYCEIGEILGHPKPQLPDLSRPPAYRLICGLDYNNRGTILAECETAEELWQAPFVHRYFSSYDVSPTDYFEDYLAEIRRTGRYTLSNTFSLVYGTVNKRGILKISTP